MDIEGKNRELIVHYEAVASVERYRVSRFGLQKNQIGPELSLWDISLINYWWEMGASSLWVVPPPRQAEQAMRTQ